MANYLKGPNLKKQLPNKDPFCQNKDTISLFYIYFCRELHQSQQSFLCKETNCFGRYTYLSILYKFNIHAIYIIQAHIVFQHIVEFLEIVNRNKECEVGLGYFSEQFFESLHSDMKVS